MINEFLTFKILNNTIAQYILFALIVLGATYATKFIYFVFKTIFRKLANKTETKLDDLLIDSIEKPIIFGVFIYGFYLAKFILYLSETISKYYDAFISISVIILVVWFIVRIIDALMINYFHPDSNGKLKLEHSVYPLFKKLINFVIYAVALLLILQNLGYQITTLIAGLGIGGLAFALAAQDLLSNLFAGVAILTDKPFKVGDRIIVAGQDGFVKRIGLRTTIIETWGGTQVVMPNKQVADSVLENVTREKARRVKMILTLEYGTSTAKLKKAKQILAKLVLNNKSTDDNSLVHFVDFSAYSIDIQLIYWIKDLNKILDTKDEINFEIKQAFEKEKINFALPSQTLYLKK